MITNSQIIEDVKQADGRRYITESHIDDLQAVPFVRKWLGADDVDAAAVMAAFVAGWNAAGGAGAKDTANVTCEDGSVVVLVRPYGTGLTVNWNLVPTATEKTAVTNIQSFLTKAQPLNDVWDDVSPDKRIELGNHNPRLKGLYQFFKRM